MREFQGLNSDYRLIQAALEALAVEGLKGQAIINRIQSFRESNSRVTDFYKGDLPDYSSVDRLRGNVTGRDGSIVRSSRSNNEPFAKLMWIFLHKQFPQFIDTRSSIERNNPTYFHMLEFYDANHTRSFQRIKEKTGRYETYHFSERFQRIKHAVVKGQIEIFSTDGSDLIEAEESEAYDGKEFGGEPIKETYSGFCLYKHSSIIMHLRKEDSERSPKVYLFDHPTLNARDMTGHLCEILPGRDLFTSPVYARRVDPREEICCNIVHHSEISSDILEKLLVNTLPGFYERVGSG